MRSSSRRSSTRRRCDRGRAGEYPRRLLEFDDLRVRVDDVTDAQAKDRIARARDLLTLGESVNEEDFEWGARVSVGLGRWLRTLTSTLSRTIAGASAVSCTSVWAPE